MTAEERFAEIEKRLDRLEGRLVHVGVNPSGMFQLRKGATIETFYDYSTHESGVCDPPIVVAESGWYVADRNGEGGQLRLEFHGAR